MQASKATEHAGSLTSAPVLGPCYVSTAVWEARAPRTGPPCSQTTGDLSGLASPKPPALSVPPRSPHNRPAPRGLRGPTCPAPTAQCLPGAEVPQPARSHTLALHTLQVPRGCAATREAVRMARAPALRPSRRPRWPPAPTTLAARSSTRSVATYINGEALGVLQVAEDLVGGQRDALVQAVPAAPAATCSTFRHFESAWPASSAMEIYAHIIDW